MYGDQTEKKKLQNFVYVVRDFPTESPTVILSETLAIYSVFHPP